MRKSTTCCPRFGPGSRRKQKFQNVVPAMAESVFPLRWFWNHGWVPGQDRRVTSQGPRAHPLWALAQPTLVYEDDGSRTYRPGQVSRGPACRSQKNAGPQVRAPGFIPQAPDGFLIPFQGSAAWRLRIPSHLSRNAPNMTWMGTGDTPARSAAPRVGWPTQECDSFHTRSPTARTA